MYNAEYNADNTKSHTRTIIIRFSELETNFVNPKYRFEFR